MYSKNTGVILKKYPLGEADQLQTIYTRERGKMRAKAVSSRKILSRLAGNLQSLNELEFETAGRGPLPILISARARTINNYLRENLKKFAFCLLGVETLYRLTPDEEQNQEVYQLLLEFLQELGRSSDENMIVRKFQLGVLNCSGYETALTPEEGRGIDQLLQQVLEREIKSEKFIQAL